MQIDCEPSYEVCSCIDFIDEDGYGNCKRLFDGTFGCYVREPTSCSDTITFFGREFSKSEACPVIIGINLTDILIIMIYI